MTAAPAAETRIRPELIPAPERTNIAAATLNAIRRTQREHPELWALIDRRAAEIRERGEYK